MKNVILIIAAGGKGSRFGAEIPKQFLEIEGTSIIVRSILPFIGVVSRVIISIAKGYEERLVSILPSEIKQILTIVQGGETRYESVKNALNIIEDENSLIAIHDAARPYVDRNLIMRVLEQASAYGAAIPVIPLVDSIREINSDGSSSARDRKKYAFVQTPQIFEYALLKKAYSMPYNPIFTDDASIVESADFKVFTAVGSVNNVKITYKSDL